MKLTAVEQKFKDLINSLPESVRYDSTPIIQKIDELTLGCQLKLELLKDNDVSGNPTTISKVTVFAHGKNIIEAQYNAFKLALVQLKLL
jgi:hypothetical protein